MRTVTRSAPQPELLALAQAYSDLLHLGNFLYGILWRLALAEGDDADRLAAGGRRVAARLVTLAETHAAELARLTARADRALPAAAPRGRASRARGRTRPA